MCTLLFADLPPYVTCQGQPASARTVNAEGLRRRGYSPTSITAVRAMYKALYRENLTLEAAKDRILQMAKDKPEVQADVDMMMDFLAGVSPKVGIVRSRRRSVD
jgi:UDP-N-acetylglucosamine acyltransferase